MRAWWKRLPVWARWVIGSVGGIMVLAILVSFFRAGDSEDEEAAFSTVLAAGRAGELESIEVRGTRVEAELEGSEVLISRVSRDTDLIAALQNEGTEIGGADGVAVVFKREHRPSGVVALLINCIFLVVFAVVMYFAVRMAVREGMRRASAD